MQKGMVVISDRGGHLHDALNLIFQMNVAPEWVISTRGPDVAALIKNQLKGSSQVLQIPQAFSWWGKKRVLNPLRFFWLMFRSVYLVGKTRPSLVFSTGAANVLPFCMIAKLWGAKVIHIENSAQVVHASFTGRVLYPWADEFYVQWPDLLSKYGAKAKFQGNLL